MPGALFLPLTPACTAFSGRRDGSGDEVTGRGRRLPVTEHPPHPPRAAPTEAARGSYRTRCERTAASRANRPTRGPPRPARRKLLW